MEKILDEEQKIRKAEEIYFRRNNQSYPISNKKQGKKSNRLKDKILLNLLIMFDLAIIVFCIQNKNFVFTKEFIEMLSKYNNDASQMIINTFSKIINSEKTTEDLQMQENDNNEKNSKETNDIENVESTIIEENISTSSMSEMELDIQNLRAAYTFINPLNGIVSSEFGARESKYQNVNGYHTGIDIAAENGTPIVASMQGIVEEVSNEGDYGKHLKIRCNNVSTLYAHCSKIFVKEGQIVAMGQKIANVGSTGNSTGPHLHFEIRVDSRFVDPAKIINF